MVQEALPVGVRFWLSQRLSEGTFWAVVAYLQGTWFMTPYLRCAKIGSWVTFGYCNVQTARDMLIIGDGTRVGDMANMITACALDAGAVLVAPIDIGKQVSST